MKHVAFIFLCLIVVFTALPILAANGSIHSSDLLQIAIKKSERILIVYRGNRILKTYHVALGKKPLGKKEVSGDNKTPEGEYVIDYHKPDSAFHKALHISYPNEEDRQRAKRANRDPGGDIIIHGLPNGLGWIGGLHRYSDWTAGCIALANTEIDELYALIPDKTYVHIVP